MTTNPTSPAAPPSAVASAPASSAGSQGPAPVGFGADMTPEQEITMWGWGLKDGLVTQQEHDEAVAKIRGTAQAKPAPSPEQTPLETPGAAPADPNAISPEDIAALDQMNPPAAAQEFVLPKFTPNGEVTPDVVAADQQSRAWLAAGELDRATGNFVAKTIAEFSPQWEQMDDAARQTYEMQTRAKLDRVWGATGPAKIALAQRFVHEIEAKQPGLIDFLERSGAGNHPMVIARMADAAARYYARRQSRKS